MANRKYILILFVLLLQSCGGDHSNEDIPLPDASNGSGIYIPPGGSNGSSGSGGGSSSSGSQGIQFEKNQSIAMATDETYQGATSDGISLYFLTEKSLTYPSKQRKIYKVDPSSGTKTLYCSWIDTDYIVGGFIAVGSNLYLYKSVISKEFKRVTISGCSQLSNLIAVDSPNSYLTPAMAFDGSNFFWSGRVGGYGSPYSLLRVNLDSASINTDLPETILGAYTTDWGSLKAIAVASGTKYAIFSPSYRSYTLWIFSGGTASVYPLDNSYLNSYSDPTQAAMIGTGTLVLFMMEYSSLKISYFGVGR